MKDWGIVKSTVKPDINIIDDYSVWVNSNIKEITETGEDGEEFISYEYNQVQYDKDEYIKLIDDRSRELETQLTDTQIALAELYEEVNHG